MGNGPGRRRRRVALVLAVGATVLEAAVVASRRGSLFHLDTVVRCRRGHLFTTLWVPGGSLKAIRLGWWRFQRCPAGHHWGWVTPARVSDLSQEDRALAARHHDVAIP